MDKKWRNIIRYGFWGAVAVLLVWLCLRAVDWAAFREALRLCRWGWVLVSMLLGVLVLYVRGLRWRMLLQPIDPSTRTLTCFNAYNICMAVNLAIPRAGELVRIGYVMKHSARNASGERKLSADKVLGVVVAERSWDAVITLAMSAVLLLAKWEDFGVQTFDSLSGIFSRTGLWLLLGGLVVAGVGFLLLCWFLRERGGLWGRIWGFVRGIGSGLGSFRHMRGGWLFLLYTALIWIFYWLQVCCIIWALQAIPDFAPLTLTDGFFLMIAGCLSSVVPVPGGFGAYHGVVAWSLSAIWGIPLGTGIIFATLSHESQTLAHALCGLASYLNETFVRKK